ncbi:MAG: hypothetical protein N2450_03200 [bacterium]|nr:hypothetical protein [bacterium]
MRKKLLILFSLFLLVLSSFAQNKPKESTPITPDLKEQIKIWDERIQDLEVFSKTAMELREQALQEAKKEIENAKKLLNQGKEQDAHSALIKARHHAKRIGNLGFVKPPKFKGKKGRGWWDCGCCEPPFGPPPFGFGYGAPPWAGERHPFGYGPWWMDKDGFEKEDDDD